MPAPRPIVLGYYADWTPNLPPSRLDYRLYTHLNHAFARVKKDGTLSPPEINSARDLCARAHAANVKILLSVGGADSGGGFAAATRTPDSVARFADQLAAAALAAGYDGIDIDWEVPTSPAERDGMNALIASLHSRKTASAPLVTMAVSATDWGGKWFLTDALQPYVDWLNIMAYDFHGPWSPHAGYNAPLQYSPLDGHPECRKNTVAAAADYWIKEKRWPKERLVLGLASYGRGFKAANWGDAAKGTYARSDLSYNTALNLQKQGWTRQWDPAAQVPYLVAPDKTELISYDDADSIASKAKFARSVGMGGVFFWEVSQDFDGRTNPLVRAAAKAFQG